MVWLWRKVEVAGEACLHQHHRLPFHLHSLTCLLYYSSSLPSDRKIYHPYCKWYWIVLQRLTHWKQCHSSIHSYSFLSSSNSINFNQIYFFSLQLNNLASIWFLALFISIIATSVLELRWSGVSIQDLWRNEQFWVIGGVSAHLFAVFQGLLKVLGGVDTNFTVTSKSADDAEFGELYLFKWTTLLIPPTTLIILNMVGVVAGVSDAINNGYGSWGPLFGKLFFAFWVIVHLYPFLKGLMGRQNRTPTIVVLWSILLASIFSLIWVRIDPFLPKQTGPILKQCGVEC